MATVPDTRIVARPPQPAAVTPAVVPVPRSGYGGLVTRVIAAAIDACVINLAAIVVAAAVALVLSIFPTTHHTRTLLALLGGALFAIWVVAYFVTFWSATGQTPGDRAMRVRVTDAGGGTIGPWRAAVRLAVAVAGLFLLIGYVPILLNDRRRAFHDWVAGTVVVNQPDTTRGSTP